MSVNHYSIFSASFVYAGPTTMNLTQLRSQSLQVGASKTVVRGSGSLDPDAHYLGTIDPRMSFASRDLYTLLSNMSITAGLYCSSGSTMRFQKRTQGGAFASSTAHETRTTTLGFLNIDSISVDRDAVEGADVALTYTPIYDGTNAIVVQNSSVDFTSAPTPAAVSVYYMGPVYHNSTQLTGLLSARINPGIQFVTRRTDGETAPGSGFITARNPMIELTFSKVDLGSTLSLFGTALSGALDLYLLRGSTGARLPTGSGTNHCKISAATGEMGQDTLEVTGEDSATVTATIRPTGTLSASLASNLP